MAFLQEPRQLLAAATGCVAGFVALLVVAYGSEPAGRVDAAAFEGFGDQLREPLVARAAEDVARLADSGPFAILAAGLVVLALMTHGAREGAAVALMLVGANVTTQLLKPLLASPRGTLGGWTFGPEAFPSGHATASMSLALAAVFVSRRRMRPLVALAGATFAIGVGFALVAIDSHFPSDIAGGFLVAAAWCFAVQAALLVAERRYPRTPATKPEPTGVSPLTIVPLAALVVAAGVGAAQLPGLVDYARGHTAFAVVAAGTAALAAALVGATAACASPRA